jgi:hypothetical protein
VPVHYFFFYHNKPSDKMRISRITLSEDYLKQLQVLVEPKENLRQHGFATKPLTDEELLLKRRCLGCGKCK